MSSSSLKFSKNPFKTNLTNLTIKSPKSPKNIGVVLFSEKRTSSVGREKNKRAGGSFE